MPYKPFGNLPALPEQTPLHLQNMGCLPQPRHTYREPRLRLTDLTPAVLRLRNGGCITGSLDVISLKGGLLCLSRPVDRGSSVKLMFLSRNGPVLGTAEMLSPVSWTRQLRSVTGISIDCRRPRGGPHNRVHRPKQSRVVEHLITNKNGLINIEPR